MTDLSTDITPPAPEPAKLRVYIGAAPGVGKTYQMLEDAHLMRKQGIDVIIGLIESHGRKDTQDQVKDLELIPAAGHPLPVGVAGRDGSGCDSCAASPVLHCG